MSQLTVQLPEIQITHVGGNMEMTVLGGTDWKVKTSQKDGRQTTLRATQLIGVGRSILVNVSITDVTTPRRGTQVIVVLKRNWGRDVEELTNRVTYPTQMVEMVGDELTNLTDSINDRLTKLARALD